VRVAAGALVGIAAVCWLGCGSDSHDGPGFKSLGSGGGTSIGGGGAGGGTSSESGGRGGSESELLGPPYPIVLAHGFFGFEDFAGAGFLSYYYGVKQHLADNGEPLVFTPAVDPFNLSEVRGPELAAHIQDILAMTGHAKVNIIGHSQGGLDARVVAHDHPEMVASVISLQTPHFGTPISDIALELVTDPSLASVLDFVAQAIGMPLYDAANEQTSVANALWQFSTPGYTSFNNQYPDAPGIYYASIAGRSDYHNGGTHCDSNDAPAWITDWNNELDPIDPLLDLMEVILDGGIGNPYPNDGLVRVVDAKWGVFLGCLPADHLDMIGQLLGDEPGALNDWDYLQFYVNLVSHIREQGF
jgi:triacylglycerol lipase